MHAESKVKVIGMLAYIWRLLFDWSSSPWLVLPDKLPAALTRFSMRAEGHVRAGKLRIEEVRVRVYAEEEE